MDLKQGKYVREMVNSNELARQNLAPNNGKYTISENIKFEDVSVITPNGDILVNNINFEIKRGENLMIVGPNGCGKSSLFRMLGKLWPLWNGHLYAPATEHLFYIPQKPYLCIGTFRDQITYPDGHSTVLKKGYTDQDLEMLLEQVQLTYLLNKYNGDGWDAVENWFDVLSGGEKQRIGMARVFYHRPKYAILDECTSAVSTDVEGYLYTHCKELGITLITISHKQDLWKYHDKKLYMYGGKDGKYEFTDMILPTYQQITCENCGKTQSIERPQLKDLSEKNIKKLYLHTGDEEEEY